MSFGPTIETLDDWNIRLAACGCCEMLYFAPVRTNKTIRAIYQAIGFFDPAATDFELYPTSTDAWTASQNDIENGTCSGSPYVTASTIGSGSGSIARTYDTPYFAGFICFPLDLDFTCLTEISGSKTQIQNYCSGGTVVNFEETITTVDVIDPSGCSGANSVNRHIDGFTNAGATTIDLDSVESMKNAVYSLGQTRTETLADLSGVALTWAEWKAEVTARFEADKADAWADAACLGTAVAYSERAENKTFGTGDPIESNLILRETRAKWQVPADYTGSYFKITFDVVFYPTVGDPSFVTEDITYEWEGPLDPGDEATRLIAEYTIPVPTSLGQNHIRNFRYENTRGTIFGIRPQVVGDSFTPPPP